MIVGSRGSAEIQQRVEEAPLLPLSPSPTYRVTVQQPALPRPGEHLRLCPLYVTGAPRQKKKMAQMKEQIRAPKIELK